jgi:uncharacterized protein GlcG (DUF336 family)
MRGHDSEYNSRTMKPLHFFAAALLTMGAAAAVHAQTMSYGTSITADMAKKIAAPAIAEAAKNKWTMAIAIVDIAGDLVYFEKMDETQVASVQIAQDKARSAARFKRPTKALQDALTATPDGIRILGLDGAVPVDGGVPISIGGKIVGAIGASGGTSAQDGQVAAAGIAGSGLK